MIRFLDTSAFAKRYITEPGTEQVRTALRLHRITVARITYSATGLLDARLRKERGFTQVAFAEKVGIIQVLVSDYERNKLRPYADIVVRFALALGVSADQLLGLPVLEKKKTAPSNTNRRWLRRLESADSLPKRDQDPLLRTIDAFLQKQS